MGCIKKYKLIFNKGVKLTPPFNDQGLITCNKWHVQGYCFKGYDRKASHKDFTNETLKAKNPTQVLLTTRAD
jgi:hypothetical protein